jgi:uncharacterized protein YlxW (UPF0749 family)
VFLNFFSVLLKREKESNLVIKKSYFEVNKLQVLIRQYTRKSRNIVEEVNQYESEIKEVKLENESIKNEIQEVIVFF